MYNILMPLSVKITIGAVLSIIVGTIVLAISIGFDFITLKSENQLVSASILDGSITLLVGFAFYKIVAKNVGQYTAEFTLTAFPVLMHKIEEKQSMKLLSENEALEVQKSLYSHVETMHVFDGLMSVAKWVYFLVLFIFIILSAIAYTQMVSLDVTKFAIFETVAIMGLCFSILVQVHIVYKNAYAMV